MNFPFKFRNKFFKPKDRLSTGLDIGTSTIKLIKLKFVKDVVELYDFKLESIQDNLKSALKRIAGEDTKIANISVSSPSTIIRYVSLPRMNNDELKESLKFEAQKHIPFSIDEVILDSYILKENLSDSKMLVLLAAIKKEFIDQHLKLIEDAGIKINILDIDSLALINAFSFNYSQQEGNLKAQIQALLDIGASMSNLNILENGIPRLSRDIHIGGNNFTQKIQDSLNIDFKSAEELKLNPDKEKLDKVIEAVESVLSNLVREVRASFDYYESQGVSSVAKIFLSGGGSKHLDLKDMLANLLGIEVEYWDPLKQINLSNSIDSQKIKLLSSQLAVAVGLALRAP